MSSFLPSPPSRSSAFKASIDGLARFAVVLSLVGSASVNAQTALSDTPVLGNVTTAGNLVLPLSVEYPTGISVAHNGAYDPARERLGYFDPNKCYRYTDSDVDAERYFQPVGQATDRRCSGYWSGNFLNWATMQTIDPFRWALTGGNRTVDTVDTTVLEKAFSTGQSNNLFPNRTITGSALIAGATPFTDWNTLTVRIANLGVRMRFTGTGNTNSDPVVQYRGRTDSSSTLVYEMPVRVRVCDNSSNTGTLESNCVRYGSRYKPEGLIQRYANRIRYSVFGYLNDSGNQRDGAVLRARQKYVGPRDPTQSPTSLNAVREWDPETGILAVNPNPDDALNANTGGYPAVANSGVINYLNKFGSSGSYKGNDPVSELYYAALRYLKNQGNVDFWSSVNGANATTIADGFPVITNWGDPVQCPRQPNFILGIGDVNTHADRNVPGGGSPLETQTTIVDATVNARTQTNAVFALEGLNYTDNGRTFNGCCDGNSAFMAGLAYDAHVRDIRSDLDGMQTVKTYWVDVLEARTYRKNNQYYLATKYGGFTVPSGFNPDTVTAATFPGTDNWNRNGQVLTAAGALGTGITVDNGNWGAGDNRRPDTYFTAGSPADMVTGLTDAFNQIASDLELATTSFSLSSPQVTASGNTSYSAVYDGGAWTGTVTRNASDFNANGSVTQTAQWNTDSTLANQFAGAGWNSNRRIVSFDGARGVPFRVATAVAGSGISAAQLALLDTPYGASGDDSTRYLNYLRGERCNEIGATNVSFPLAQPACAAPPQPNNTGPQTDTRPQGYRARTDLLGDIVGSKLTAVGAPSARYSDATNPGYAAFQAAQANRTPLVFFGANDGMLHALDGRAASDGGGQEVFAYVPSALFAGPSGCSSADTCAVDALVSRGNPSFLHKAMVDATPLVFDIDFARANGALVTGNDISPNWRSVLIGGLGKGGRRYYAIDVTSPGDVTTETGWASRVLWEFPNASVTGQATAATQMGFTFGAPLVTKLARFGWVVIFPSGYTSPAGGTTRSYLFIVNPRTGALLETITLGTSADPSYDVAQVQAYRRDFADNTAESLYAGDALGNVWRVDVRGTGAYPAPTLLARLTSPTTGARQPITTRPLVEIDPATGRRFVLVGTGRLLDQTDINSTQTQSFYAIVDGTRGAFRTTGLPVTRSVLTNNTDATLVGSGVTDADGWVIDLGSGGTPARSWRVSLDPTSSAGRVQFASLLPDTGTCSSASASRFYSVDFGTGQSVLINTTNDSVAYNSYSDVIIDIVQTCVGANCSTNVGTRTGGVSRVNERPPVLPGLRRLNWRELQIVQ